MPIQNLPTKLQEKLDRLESECQAADDRVQDLEAQISRLRSGAEIAPQQLRQLRDDWMVARAERVSLWGELAMLIEDEILPVRVKQLTKLDGTPEAVLDDIEADQCERYGYLPRSTPAAAETNRFRWLPEFGFRTQKYQAARDARRSARGQIDGCRERLKQLREQILREQKALESAMARI